MGIEPAASPRLLAVAVDVLLELEQAEAAVPADPVRAQVAGGHQPVDRPPAHAEVQRDPPPRLASSGWTCGSSLTGSSGKGVMHRTRPPPDDCCPTPPDPPRSQSDTPDDAPRGGPADRSVVTVRDGSDGTRTRDLRRDRPAL